MTEAKWYIVHVSGGSENRIASELKAQFEKFGLSDSLVDVFVPKKDVMIMKRGVKVKSEDRILPGYVFVNMICTPETVHTIRRLPRVVGILGDNSETPRPLNDMEVQSLLKQVDELSQLSQSSLSFDPGEVVKVCSGLFDSMQGVVEEVNYEKSRLKISITILGRSTPVDLDFSQVEKM